MKKKLLYILSIGVLSTFTGKAFSQTDTLVKPDRPRTYTDPKITPEHDKILLDTSKHLMDSLLDNKKTGRKPMAHPKTNPMGEADRPVKPITTKRAPGDTSTVRP